MLGARAQALRRAAHDDADRLAPALAEDVLARRARDAADARPHQHLAVERHLEVGREREQVRLDAREVAREACALCRERRERAPGVPCIRWVRWVGGFDGMMCG